MFTPILAKIIQFDLRIFFQMGGSTNQRSSEMKWLLGPGRRAWFNVHFYSSNGSTTSCRCLAGWGGWWVMVCLKGNQEKTPTCHLVHLQNFGEICDFWDISIICITFVSVIWDWMRRGRCDKMVWRRHVIMEIYDVLTVFALCRRIVAESLESITFSYDQTVHLPQINSSLHGFWSLPVDFENQYEAISVVVHGMKKSSPMIAWSEAK